ncbi:MAG: adenylate/guanylate cyclase domain-containing protein [Dehalococcoidia bacterium]
MPELPIGTVTFLFTDIEESTLLLHNLGERYATVQAEHRALLRAVFATYHGLEVDTQGDSFLVAFPRATEAVAAAVAGQRQVGAHAWPEGGIVRVRMGLHTGEPVRTDEGYIGLDVVRGARIGAAGHGGQILLSPATANLVLPSLPEGVSLRDLGEYRLKGLRRPERIFQILAPELQTAFAPLQSLGEEGRPVPSSQPPGTRAVLFSDLVGFTDQLIKLGDRAAQLWLRAHNRILREQFVRFGALEQKSTGDGFLATFADALHAVDCAVAIQRALQPYNDEHPEGEIHVRIALHFGEVLKEGEELVGTTVRFAARMVSKIQQDQILASELLHGMVRSSSEHRFTERGVIKLQGFERREHLYEVRWQVTEAV